MQDVGGGGDGGAWGGGGGSGGGGAGGGEQMGTSAIINLDQNKQQIVTLKKVARLYIIWQGKEYSAKISLESSSIMKIEFSKLGVSILMPVGESSTMDLDQDGKTDAIFEIEGIDRNTVTIRVTRWNNEDEQGMISDEKKPTREEPSQQFLLQTAKKALLNKDLIGITVILIVAGIIVEMERRTKKKKK